MKHSFLVLSLFMFGCSRFMHLNDSTIDNKVSDLCSLLAAQNRPALEAEAKRQGVSFEVLVATFEGACALRVKDGLEPAKRAGFAAARHDAGAP